jgi:hypothetical protein
MELSSLRPDATTLDLSGKELTSLQGRDLDLKEAELLLNSRLISIGVGLAAFSHIIKLLGSS